MVNLAPLWTFFIDSLYLFYITKGSFSENPLMDCIPFSVFLFVVFSLILSNLLTVFLLPVTGNLTVLSLIPIRTTTTSLSCVGLSPFVLTPDFHKIRRVTLITFLHIGIYINAIL